jgi:hypothetical protein
MAVRRFYCVSSRLRAGLIRRETPLCVDTSRCPQLRPFQLERIGNDREARRPLRRDACHPRTRHTRPEGIVKQTRLREVHLPFWKWYALLNRRHRDRIGRQDPGSQRKGEADGVAGIRQ